MFYDDRLTECKSLLINTQLDDENLSPHLKICATFLEENKEAKNLFFLGNIPK